MGCHGKPGWGGVPYGGAAAAKRNHTIRLKELNRKSQDFRGISRPAGLLSRERPAKGGRNATEGLRICTGE